MLIATDLDEILASYLSSFFEFHNKKYHTSLTKNDLKYKNLLEICGKTEEELIEKLYCFFKTPYFKNIEPIPGAIEGINVLKENHDLIIVTARQKEISKPTTRWVEKYFPNTFSDIIFTNGNSKNGKMKTKAEVCCNLEVNTLIEDRIEYAIDCSYNGNKVILLDYPWNQGHIPKKITRVNSWNEIIETINQNNH